MGYYRAGFDVVGVDIKPQPHYPFEFYQADALEFPLEGFDVIHASPPCQAYTRARKLQGNTHPELIEPIRFRLRATDLPYIVENVPGSPLLQPVMLCGTMFDRRIYRHRLFESNAPLVVPCHPTHTHKSVKMGRPPKDNEFIQVVGHFSGADLAREVMDTPWMSKEDMREAIPPYYTEFIGKQIIEQLEALELAA